MPASLAPEALSRGLEGQSCADFSPQTCRRERLAAGTAPYSGALGSGSQS